MKKALLRPLPLFGFVVVGIFRFGLGRFQRFGAFGRCLSGGAFFARVEVAIDEVAPEVGDGLHEKRLRVGAEGFRQNNGEREGFGVCAFAEDRRLRVEKRSDAMV